MNKFKALMGALAVAALPMTASALTTITSNIDATNELDDGTDYGAVFTTRGGEAGSQLMYTFTNNTGGAVKIDTSGFTGPNIGGLVITFNGTTLTIPAGTTADFISFLDVGESSDFFLDYGVTNPNVSQGTFGTSLTVAAVPLPAGALLLVSAIGGMAIARRRKTAAKA